MKEFFRKNIAWFQFVLGAAAFFGMADWKTLHELLTNLNTRLNLGGNVFSGSWWIGAVLGVPGIRIFFAAIVLGTISNAIFTFRTRNKPLSILSTDVSMKFTDGGAKAVISRRQVLHANRPGIAAYFIKITLESPPASFERDPANSTDVTAWLESPPGLAIVPRSIGRRNVRDVNLCFTPALPYNWILSVIPRWVLGWGPNNLPKFIGRYLVVQNVTYTALKEYDDHDAKYQATSTRYLHNKITIKLDFSADTGPCPKSPTDISVMRRISNAVFDEHAIPTNQPGVYTIDIGSGMNKDETIVVTWARRPLKDGTSLAK